jgi:hypothetical protein
VRRAAAISAVLMACSPAKPAAPAQPIGPVIDAGVAVPQPPTSNNRTWERPGGDHAGQCCTSAAECGGLACDPYGYGHEGCRTVCTIHCSAGDLCPGMGGGGEPEPVACPSDGRCPVGPPNA